MGDGAVANLQHFRGLDLLALSSLAEDVGHDSMVNENRDFLIVRGFDGVCGRTDCIMAEQLLVSRSRESSPLRSMKLSARMWTTFPARCRLPRTARKRADITVRRLLANTFGQTMMLAMSVSVLEGYEHDLLAARHLMRRSAPGPRR